MSDRWIANKFGLFDFWYYDEEEFELSNGKIIFRGTNGSGKSVTTQSFIPLLLDGDKRPNRLDPFGSSARKIENYLLLNEEENDKIAYLYMEFVKPSSNTYLTIGIGFRARRGKKLDCWHFILKDGRRINKELKLYKKREGKKFALTDKEFKNALGEGNIYTTSPKEYMEKVNEHLFGYSDIDSYKDLLNLLIQVRSPKLSKDFKPTVIYEILKSSLSLLSEDDLRTMSEAMDNMDSLNNKLEELKKSRESAIKIRDSFNRYNLSELYNKSRNYYSKRTQVKKLNIDLENLNLEKEEILKDIEKNKSELETYINKLNAAKIKEEVLKNSEGFNARDKLCKAEEELKELVNNRDKNQEKYNKKNDDKIKKDKEIKNLDLEVSHIINEVKMLLDDEEYFREEGYIQEDFELKDILNNDNFIFEDIRSSVNEYDKLVRDAYSLILQFDNCKKEFNTVEEQRDLQKGEVESVENKLKESIEYLTNLKSEYIEEVNEYLGKVTEFNIDEKELVNLFKEINDIKEIANCSNILNTIKEISEPIRHNIFENKITLENKKKSLQEDINNINNEILSIENSKELIEDTEDIANCKKILSNNNIPFESFYKCINFNDGISEERKINIEGSLFNMGILNSLIIPLEYKEKSLECLKGHEYKIIFAEKSEEISNIKDDLILENNDFVEEYKSQIEKILKSISIDNNNKNNTFIKNDLSFGIGIINGGSYKDYDLKYIGLESRENFRKLKIEQLNIKKEDIENELNNTEKLILFTEEKLNKLQEEIDNFPKTNDIEVGIKIINETKNQLEVLEKTLNSLEEKLLKVKNELDQLNIKVFNATEYIKIPKNKESYDNAIKNITEYSKVIGDLSEKVTNLRHKKSDIKRIMEIIDELNEDMDSIYGDLLIVKDKIDYTNNTVNSLKETLLKLNLGELEKEYAEVTNIINLYPDKISNIKENIVRSDEKIKSLDNNFSILQKKITRENNILDVYTKVLENELNLKYIKELDNLTVEESVAYIMKNYESFNISQKENTLSKLFDVYNKFKGDLGDYSLSSGDIFDNYDESEDEEINEILSEAVRTDIKVKFNRKVVSIYSLVEELNDTIEVQNLLISNKEREVFEDTLINTLSTKINAKIHLATSWVNQINKLMEDMNTSNKFKLSLKWIPKKSSSEEELDIRELTKILGTPDFMSDEQREKVSNHFKESLKKEKRIAEEDGTIRSYQGIISDVLDYRQWFDFQLWYSKSSETKKELTDNAFFRLSGGEKAMAMYIPLFAAVNARYNGADKKDCPRIIALDEAFAGVDDQNIAYMFELIESLKLDYVLNSQVLWGTYESIKSLSIYELIRQGEEVVLPIKYHWNGKVKSMETKIEI